MCLNPIPIRNPTKNIPLQGGSLMKMRVSCGHCAECVSKKRNEWYFRSYQQVLDVLRKGGYVYFDTLTYNDANLPKLSHFIDVKEYKVKNFSCFNHAHFKSFLKRLRRRLDYYFGDSSFKYFLTSEYGEDDRYTHRPHYHILFYVNSRVHPLDFSRAVSECWTYGRTDGIKYKPLSYVAEHVYGRNLIFGSNPSQDVLLSVCNYVSKYINKSSTFRKKLEKRIYMLQSKLEEDDLKKVVRQVDMFHRQSQGFGLSFLNHLSADDFKFLQDGIVVMPDSVTVVKSLPLPMYYKRHLYYDLIRRSDKTYYWQLKDDCIEHYNESRYKDFDKVYRNTIDTLSNMKKEQTDVIYNMLGNRSIGDYVVYQMFYKGRLRDVTFGSKLKKSIKYGLTDDESNLYDWQKKVNSSLKNNSLNKDDLYNYDRDRQVVLIPDSLYDDTNLFYDTVRYVEIPYKDFIRLYTFNQTSCDEFRYFDDIENYIDSCTKFNKKNKQNTFDFLEDYKNRLKVINYG